MCVRQIIQTIQINQLRQLFPGSSMQAHVDWRRQPNSFRHLLPLRGEHEIRALGGVVDRGTRAGIQVLLLGDLRHWLSRWAPCDHGALHVRVDPRVHAGENPEEDASAQAHRRRRQLRGSRQTLCDG